VGSLGLLLDRDASTLSWGSASTTAGSWSLSGQRYILSIVDVRSSTCELVVVVVVVDAAAVPCPSFEVEVVVVVSTSVGCCCCSSSSTDSELVTRGFVATSKLD